MTNGNAVKEANRRFYDAVADKYEQADGRRSKPLESWLSGTLKGVRGRVSGERLLDLGAGSGFVARCAKGIFEERVGFDISAKILAANISSFDLAVAGDVDKMPFKAQTFDAISCFAVLHHLFDFENLIKESSRVLKTGGILYCDHDMDKVFFNRFKYPLLIYRKLRDAAAKYKALSSEITSDIYHLSEWNENGIDTAHISGLLANSGFDVEVKYHWYGLNGLTDKIFGKAYYNRGFAPLVRIIAVKK